MGTYTIIFTTQADLDIVSLSQYIQDECKAPLTARRYVDALFVRIKWLEHNADIFAVVPELSIQLGTDVRRLNFGNMTILYSIEEDKVYIHRIIPQSSVIY